MHGYGNKQELKVLGKTFPTNKEMPGGREEASQHCPDQVTTVKKISNQWSRCCLSLPQEKVMSWAVISTVFSKSHNSV